MSEDIPFKPSALRHGPSHYYGDTVRILYVVAAILIFLLYFTGTEEIFPTSMSIALILALVVTAGLTNVVQIWTQWLNVLVGALGLVMFSWLTVERFSAFSMTELMQDLIIASLAVIFVVGLYLAVRTLRGGLMRGAPVIR